MYPFFWAISGLFLLDNLPRTQVRFRKITLYISWYEKEIEAPNKSNEKEVDDDGWEIVKDDRTKYTESNQMKAKQLLHQKRKSQTLDNFYRHQNRQKKMSKLDLIRSAYEESKKQIIEARKTRTFKPF